MTSTIPLTVTAKNEEGTIAGCLDSLLEAKRVAEAALPLELDLLVVLDDCTDRTEERVARAGVLWARSSGGKVEAQRRGWREGPFQLFSDADIEVMPDTLRRLSVAMLERPELAVAFPAREPKAPRRKTPLARALHLYNLRHGYSSQRSWFNGKLFAIRDWHVPTRAETLRRAAKLRPSRFYDYDAGMRIDDIYLSRRALLGSGVEGIREIDGAVIRFRAPETWLGMYRYYRRMRMELERLDRLFPETAAVHRQHGRREQDLLSSAPLRERAYHALFSAALQTCRGAYHAERLYYERWSSMPCDPWPPIPETKRA